MKRAYISVKSLLSAGAAILLSWLGFTSCGDTPFGGGGMAEYGTPYVEFDFKIRVTDQNDRPVRGLQIDVEGNWDDDKEYTNANGYAEVDGEYTGFHQEHEAKIVISDVDGEKNGVVANQVHKVKILESDFTSKGKKRRWNNGSIEKKIDITVERR